MGKYWCKVETFTASTGRHVEKQSQVVESSATLLSHDSFSHKAGRPSDSFTGTPMRTSQRLGGPVLVLSQTKGCILALISSGIHHLAVSICVWRQIDQVV